MFRHSFLAVVTVVAFIAAAGAAQARDQIRKAFGIFGFSFLEQNTDKVQGSTIDGRGPTFENISDGSYPVSRPMYFYAKKAHIGSVPGIREYMVEFTSDKAMGPDGYLADKGLISMSETERADWRTRVNNLANLVL